MTVLLYDYCELEERAARHLKTWKVCHLILFSLAAIFGVANYVLLQNTMELIDGHCVLYPRLLEFHAIPKTRNVATHMTYERNEVEDELLKGNQTTDASSKETFAQDAVPGEADEKNVTKREILDKYNETMDTYETTMDAANVTVITGNRTHQMVLDTSRSLFALENDCQFAEYMPVMSTVCALVWVTLFTMCPGGGRARSGLQQPWRILTPALLFALVLLGLTGHSFSRTNGGLHAFCAAFANLTNSTKCSSVDPFLEKSQWTSWGFGSRAAALRAASAGTFAAWACASALLLARCLAAPDFVVKRTGAYLKDPHGKLTPHLKKGRRMQRSLTSSPGKRDNLSLRSDPTFTTELATASVERGQDSAPTSLAATPLKRDTNNATLIDTPARKDRDSAPSLMEMPIRKVGGDADLIEMSYTPQERRLIQ